MRRKKFNKGYRIICTTLFIISLLITTSNAQVLSAEKIYETVLPSIMTLEVLREDGNSFIGTAFLIKREGIAVTCFHVIQDAQSVKARFSDGEEFLVSGIIDKDEKRDIAVIRVKCFKDNFLTLVPKEPSVGQEAFVIGTPKGLEFSISDGIISQVQTIGGMKQYQFTCPVSPGNSGSPLIDNQGNVIGLVTWQIKEGQNLNFAIPSKYILGLDYSLPTTPWDNVQKETDLITTIHSDQQFDKLLAEHLTNYQDLNAAIYYVRAVNVYRDNGYNLSLPPEYYTAVMNTELTLNELEGIINSDDKRMAIKESVIFDTKKLLSSADLIKGAVETARRRRGWDHQSEDLLSQSHALLNLKRGIEKEDFLYMSKSKDFIKELDDEIKAHYDGRMDSLGYSLGVLSFPKNPLLLVSIFPDGYADEFGLQNFDKVLSVDGVIVNNIYEIKKTIYESRGKTIEIELLRDKEREVIEIDIPYELN